MTALQLVGAFLLLLAGVGLLRSVATWRRPRTLSRTPSNRRARLVLGGYRFAYTGVGLAGLALLLSPALPGDWRAGLLVLAVTDMVLGVYLLGAAC